MKLLLFNFILASFFLNFCRGEASFKKYVPLQREEINGDHKIIEVPKLKTKEHLRAFVKVLEKYDEEFVVIGDFRDVEISSVLAKDKDLLANYTKKAEGERIK